MSWVGPITLVNRSSERCSLVGRPSLSFANATSRWKETRYTVPAVMNLHDPLAPPRGSLRALAPGEHVSVMLWWSNWCGAGAKPGGVMTKAPSAIVLAAPGGGSVHLTKADGRSGLPSPVCNGGRGSVSVLQASQFMPFVPQGPPSSALPLKASILSNGPGYVKGARIAGPTLRARPGHWLPFTVVLTNTGRRPFRFGRTCPAYTEGVSTQSQAYVLNCHAVGAIAPHRSVRFAMRLRVPADTPTGYAFGWTLAPHSFNAPQAMATLLLR